MDDQVFIQYRFTIDRDGLSFSDALVMLKSEYDALTPQDIATMKEQRYQNWLTQINNPPPEEEE